MRLLPLLLLAGAQARTLLTNVTLDRYRVYWATVEVGSPPRPFSVIVDTGSNDAAVPCADCFDCGASHRRWNASESASARPAPGNASLVLRYAEGSRIEGRVVEDTLCLDGVCVEGFPVACVFNESRIFRTQEADGIFGLGGPFLDAAGAFSLCAAAGELDVGMPRAGADYDWVPTAGPYRFTVELAGPPRRRYAHVDSGSTSVVMPRAARYLLRQTGLCEVAFANGVRVPLRPCIPYDDIAEADYYALGADFLRRVPRVVFTDSHIGFGVRAPGCLEAPAPEDDAPALALAGVFLAYLAAVAMSVQTFLM